ncbi:MAG: potassium channel protein [Pelosinus sp.]|nr:potassium channel protein [Pelosinus sp.]
MQLKNANSPLTRLKLSLALFFFLIFTGVIGFMLLEQVSFFDALYWAALTITTVGYGDVVPRTFGGRVFTVVFVTTGVGTAYYTFWLLVSMTIEGQMQDILGRRGMHRKIASLKNHIIVCGAGKVGSNVIRRLQNENEEFVVVEKDQALYENLMEQKVLAVFGDATLDEVLLSAGILTAKGIITALSHDADNVYVTLTAKSLNPELNIVARADRPEAEEKLMRAGATTVVFPSVMGGRQMVSAITKPIILDFVENLFYNQELHMDIAEIMVCPNSFLVGKSFIASNIKERFDSIVVAIKRGDGLITNPRATEIILDGDILIVLGQRSTLSELNALAQQDMECE